MLVKMLTVDLAPSSPPHADHTLFPLRHYFQSIISRGLDLFSPQTDTLLSCVENQKKILGPFPPFLEGGNRLK